MAFAALFNRHDPRARPGRPRVRANGRVDLHTMGTEQLADLAMQLDGSAVPGVRMTEREFVDWAFQRADAEWVNGEVILMAPASDAHSDLDIWIGSLIQQFNEAKPLGVVRRDMFVRFARRKQRRVPDLMFISDARRHRIRPTYIDGAPDLIVEIVSQDSRNRDRRDKYLQYEAGGVREYWIIDPLLETLDVYALRRRKFEDVAPVDDRIHSRVLPGLFLRTKWLFGKSRPKVSQVLKEFDVKG